MKKTMWIALALLVLLQVNFPPELAARGGHRGHGGHKGHVGVDILLGAGLVGMYYPYYSHYPYYYDRYPYYPYSYYTAPPVIIDRQPQEYIVRPDPEPEETAYWYYCQNPKGYYPYVQRCPNGWMKVVPSAPPAD